MPVSDAVPEDEEDSVAVADDSDEELDEETDAVFT